MPPYIPPHLRNRDQRERNHEPTIQSQDLRTRDRNQHASHRKPRGKGAPTRFGSIGQRLPGALRPGEDVPGAKRLDDEGMVYLRTDGSVVFFQDRTRKYPFYAGLGAVPLLRGLLAVNSAVFAQSLARVAATGDADRVLAHGEALYADKPTMKAHHGALGTWSDTEYAHPGLQFIYLKLKSFQRFTESWALFERCASLGVFDDFFQPRKPTQTLMVASLGGGPGYELIAFEWFIRYWTRVRGLDDSERHDILTCMEFPPTSFTMEKEIADLHIDDKGSTREGEVSSPPPMKLISLDLQPSWDVYVAELGKHSEYPYKFEQWDIKGEVDALTAAARSGFDCLDLCIISNVFVYCTDEKSADVLTALLENPKGPRALLVNERGAEQRLVELLEARGCAVLKLLSQHAGRDDRQLLVVPKQASRTEDFGGPKVYPSPVFPNVPYEESKN